MKLTQEVLFKVTLEDDEGEFSHVFYEGPEESDAEDAEAFVQMLVTMVDAMNDIESSVFYSKEIRQLLKAAEILDQNDHAPDVLNLDH